MVMFFKNIQSTIKDMDKILLIIMILLSVFGLFNIVTASGREAVTIMDQSVYYYFYRHLVVLIGAFIAFILIINIDTRKYYWLVPLLFIVVVVLNCYVLARGAVTRGATNWIDLGFFKLQPSELAKPVMIAVLALFIEKNGKKFRNPKTNHYNLIWKLIIIGIIIPIIVFFQKDAGTMLIQLMIFGMIYLLSPIIREEKWKIIGVAVGVIAVALLGLYAFRGYILTDAQLSRLNFLNPCKNYQGDGYQVCNAYISINLGGLNGVGIGKSTQKYSYIPEPHTDMVFAILTEEDGFIVGAIIIILYAVMIYRIMMLASRANSIRGKYMCLGIGTYIMAHIIINLGGLFGLIPLTGVPLPFLSYGGSFTLSLIASLGIVQRICIETNRFKLKF